MPEERKPGDVFLNRYMPTATAAEREVARETLYRFAAILARIGERLGLEDYERAIRAEKKTEVELADGPPPQL